MDYRYWRYFLSLENDFIKTIDYVEICDENKITISIRFLQLILSIGSEIDVTLKRFCNIINKKPIKKSDIEIYRPIILKAYPKFHNLEILIPRYGMKIHPWETWGENINPDWWHAYNCVKHERNIYFDIANLKNTISSMAGLFGVLLYMYKVTETETILQPWAELFDCKGSPGSLMIDNRIILPDFP